MHTDVLNLSDLNDSSNCFDLNDSFTDRKLYVASKCKDNITKYHAFEVEYTSTDNIIICKADIESSTKHSLLSEASKLKTIKVPLLMHTDYFLRTVITVTTNADLVALYNTSNSVRADKFEFLSVDSEKSLYTFKIAYWYDYSDIDKHEQPSIAIRIPTSSFIKELKTYLLDHSDLWGE